MKKEIILSGVQPTGKLHIGNYLGSLRNFVELQKKHDCLFAIVDYHSITADYDPRTKQDEVIELGKEFLAAGLDPKKCTLFIQSYVPEHMELAWILNTVTPVSFLERMTQYKDKAGRQKQNINLGLFDYPVLQAADILIYKATTVPVGKDQEQHLELTRQIARFFNNKFGNTFKEPKTLFTDTPKVMSLLAPDKKMSKSLGDNHCIYIDDKPEVIQKKLAKAVTDTGDGKSLGAKNLIDLVKIFGDQKTYQDFQTKSQTGNLQYSELKQKLAEDIAKYFSDFRKAKAKISDTEVKKVFITGSKKAQAKAAKNLEEIRKKIGIR
ncbi:MAG: tryptophan--tRNA ligase [Parcubacteria group bacterium]|nr:tryptophan--tRNA ligase [Parcubacteria group bacterium]|tara:strand:- start:7247 stop:8215 length:969 start_codon:yes stop_codon:yes gene_type:complete